METVILPGSEKPRALPFYLALEEWLAREYPGRDFFFMWQVNPTVIIGRHQLLRREVDVDFCRSHGVDIVRRKSGGGAVVADMNNVMMSYVTTSSEVTTTFAEYTGMVARVLRSLGLDASDNSRNDILIGDRKVSGNSFYRLGDRSIVHGTLLYDFDSRLMSHAITPDNSKLQGHGVRSVKSRVTTLKSYLPHLSIAEIKSRMLSALAADGALTVSEGQVAEIERMETEYRRPDWLKGKEPKAVRTFTARLEGVGTVSVHIDLDKDRIRQFAISGDYLSIADDVQDIIAATLHDVEYSRADISRALSRVDLGRMIPGLERGEFIKLIC